MDPVTAVYCVSSFFVLPCIIQEVRNIVTMCASGKEQFKSTVISDCDEEDAGGTEEAEAPKKKLKLDTIAHYYAQVAKANMRRASCNVTGYDVWLALRDPQQHVWGCYLNMRLCLVYDVVHFAAYDLLRGWRARYPKERCRLNQWRLCHDEKEEGPFTSAECTCAETPPAKVPKLR